MATPEQTPFLHLNLDGDEAENRNWVLLDDRLYQLARRVLDGLPAGGDLTGTYPDPLIRDLAVTDSKIVSVSWSKVTGVPPLGIPEAPQDSKLYGRRNAAWTEVVTSGGGAPTGPAGGDLAGTYPDPLIGALKVTRAKIAADAWLSPIPAGADVGKVLTVAAGPTLSWATGGAGAALSGFKLWTFNATTTTPPAAGEIRLNQTNQATVTLVYISNTTADNVDLKHLLPKIPSGQRLYIQDTDTGAKYAVYAISGTPIDQGTYTQFPVTWVENGSVITAEPVFLEVLSTSASGGASWTQANPFISPTDTAVTGVSLTNPVDASGTDQATLRLTSASASAAREPVVTLRKARASGAAVSVSDVLARLDITPCQGSSVFARSGFLAFSATEGHTAGAKGTSFQLAVAPTGSATASSTLDFTQAGNVTISGSEYRAKQTQIIQQAAGYLEISSNQLGITGQNAGIPTWIQRLDQTGDLWQVWRKPTPAGTAVALMTLDNAATLTLPTAGIAPSLVLGSTTVKTRLANQNGIGLELATNTGNGNNPDDAAKPAWLMQANLTLDNLKFRRSPAGAIMNVSDLMTLDATGSLTVPGTLKCGAYSINSASASNASLSYNDAYAPMDAAKCSWLYQLEATTTSCYWYYRAPSAGAGAITSVMILQGAGNLIINGSLAQKATGTTWSNPSDRRLKDNIIDYTIGLATIMQLQPRQFIWNGKGGSSAGTDGWGFIADEVEPIMPEMIGTTSVRLDPGDPAETEIQTLDQSNLILALVNAVKELSNRVAALETP